MGGPDATPNLWKQLFSAVRASGGYPGNGIYIFEFEFQIVSLNQETLVKGRFTNLIIHLWNAEKVMVGGVANGDDRRLTQSYNHKQWWYQSFH